MGDNTKQQSNKDIYLCLCAAIPFFENLIVLTIGYLGNRIGLRNTAFAETMFYLLFILFYFLWIYTSRKISIFPIILFSIFLISYLYVLFFSPESISTQEKFSALKYLMFYPVVASVFFEMDCYELFLDYIKKFNRVLIIIAYIYLVLEYIRSGFSYDTYNMDMGYQLSFSCILFLLNLSKKFNVYDLINAIVSGILAIVFGSRGAFLAIGIYCIILIYRHFIQNKTLIKKVSFSILLSSAFLVLYTFFNYIMLSFSKFLSSIGITSRTVSLFLSSDFAYDSGRSDLQQFFLSKLGDMPIFGYGILGDRKILAQIGEEYVHNIILELIADYGFVFGVLIIVVLTIKIVKLLRGKLIYNDIGIATTCYCITFLMLSSSYLLQTVSFIVLGILCNSKKQRAKE